MKRILTIGIFTAATALSGSIFAQDQAPAITGQPQSQTVLVGSNVIFSISLSGTPPLVYQWLLGGTNLTDGARLAGSQGDVLTISSAQASDVGSYEVIVTNIAGAVTSSVAVLTVIAPDLYAWSTIAGLPGTAGNLDGTNQTTLFSTPSNVAVDTDGNVYVSDRGNSEVRLLTRMGTNWVASTIARNLGDTHPSGVAVDTQGNVFIAGWRNTVQKITRTGTNWVVTTIAGLDGVSGSADGPGSTARFFLPQGPAVDAGGNVYVADRANNTIRKISPSGASWVVATIAGRPTFQGSTDGSNSAARFYSPSGVTLDRAGNLYVVDQNNSTIRSLTPIGTNWVTRTIVGRAGVVGSADGANGSASFSGPGGLVVDNATNIYVADSNHTIRKVLPSGTNWVATTIGGQALVPGSADGTGTAALFNVPNGVAVDSAGNLYVADFWNNTIRLGTPLSITNLNQPATLQAPDLTAPNTIALRGTGGRNSRYFIWASTNVSTPMGQWWLLGSTNASPAGVIQFVDPDATNPIRFYRLAQ